MKSLMDRVARPAMETVDFEHMNRVPEQTGLREERAEVVPGMLNVWYEYIPASYDGQTAVPLVLQIHGGGQDGRRWASYTVWHRLAETHGFLVVYPNSPRYGMWNCDARDIQYLYDLIALLKTRYHIDESRIYMQGMSNGDMMTLAFSMKHPEVLAAAGYMTGPASAEALDGDCPCGALPILQMRGELDVNWQLTPDTVDVYANRYGMNDLNRELWEGVNGTAGVLPTVSIHGKDNFLYFEGAHAPVVQWEIQGMGHREPVYSAQVLWDRLYSGCARLNGSPVVEAARKPIADDDDTVLLALGSNKAWRGNQLIPISPLEGGVVRLFTPAPAPHFCPVPLQEMCETEVLCAPVDVLAHVFGASLRMEDAGETAVVRLADGRTVYFRSQSLLMEIDGEYAALQKPSLLLGGSLYIPIAEVVQQLLGKHVFIAEDMICISDHYVALGRYTASVLHRMMGGTPRPRGRAL